MSSPYRRLNIEEEDSFFLNFILYYKDAEAIGFSSKKCFNYAMKSSLEDLNKNSPPILGE